MAIGFLALDRWLSPNQLDLDNLFQLLHFVDIFLFAVASFN